MDPTQNKYAVYRNIRYKRTYRTLGKMSWWRIVIGVALIVYVLLLSGFVSQRMAAKQNFTLAEKLMISPQWMEKYKPETKAFIEAGVIYQDGNYAEAAEAFSVIEEVEAALQMESLSYLMLADEEFSAGEYESAFEAIKAIDREQLSEDNSELYVATCSFLLDYYKDDSDKAEVLEKAISAYTVSE